ncbi:MAG: YeeE/YedE family protein, partial [Candidatus Aminicenantes bacterium]
MATHPSSERRDGPRRGGFALTVIAGLGVLAAAVMTGRWVLSAFPLGLLFGFFLQKGDLCGASAFSEVLLMRDGRKVFGVWVGIVVAMAGFAGAGLLGLAPLNPKPLLWVNDIVGGLVFGAGTVLAGGCISGCLYKSAMGNLNSIAALLTIPIGIAFVEHGPLTRWAANMKAIKTTAAGGGPVTLSSLSGLPFWSWALAIAGLTAGIVLLRGRKRGDGSVPPIPPVHGGRTPGPLSRPWKPWQAGLAIGLVVVASLFSSAAAGRNYPIGVTHGVLHVQELLTESSLIHVAGPVDKAPAPAAAPGARRINWWLVLVVFGTFFGSLASASLQGRVRLQPKPPEQVVTALGGGFLVGAGAAMATGCI